MTVASSEPGFPALGPLPHAQGLVYGSVCSGIEAATVAWEPLGWRPAFFAEIEPFPAAVLAERYPAIPNLGDMTAIDATAWRGKIDVLVGGTPCQAFSVAGLRKSLDDTRGNLALKFVELADAVDPAWVVWENVPGVLSTRDNAFGCLLGGLAGEDGPLLPPGGKWPDAGVVFGPARTVAWRVLDAQYFGLAQRRRRVFVVAGAGDRADPVQVLLERQGVRRDHPPRRETEQTVAPTLDGRAGRSGETSFATSGGLIAEAFGGNNTSGPIEVATALNACTSASGRMDFETETFVAHSLRAKSNLAHRPDIDTLVTLSLLGEGFDASEDGTGRGTPLVPVALSTEQTPKFSSDLAFTLTKQSPSGGGQIQSVAIPIQEAGARTGVSTSDPRAGIGIGSDGDPMFTLQAGKPHAVAFNLRGRDGGAQAEVDADNLVSLRAASGGSSRSYVAFAQNQRDEVRTLEVAGALAAEPGTKQQTYVAFDCKASAGFQSVTTDGVAPTLRAMNAQGRENGGGQLAITVPLDLRNALRDAEKHDVMNRQGLGIGDENDPAPTLSREHTHGVIAGLAVRRLTPRECERLQGFPNDYTQIPWRRKAAKDCPDGPRYRSLGNSMAVPVMAWIGRRIQNAGK
ncbi:MAG: DNA cytosine methyltransferase [Rhodospirillales bacterium]|nr:DNA cytosine methyltransferase [Rhodospirillales bacterium]